MINLKNTRLLGHRGARHEAFENTLFGFQYAQSLQQRGLSGVEFDVQVTADEHLVVFHDDNLQRLCGIQSRVDQLSLTEIQRHLQSGHHIITLDSLAQAQPPSLLFSSQHSSTRASTKPQSHVLNQLLGVSPKTLLTPPVSALTPIASLAHFAHIELEVKTHDRTNYAKLIRALTRYLIDSPLASLPIVLTSFDTQLLAQLQRNNLLSPISRGLLVRAPELLMMAPNTALQLGCKSLGVHYPLLNETVIKNCHRYGLPVSAWTVNDIEQIKQLVEWEVDVIITDIPTQIL